MEEGKSRFTKRLGIAATVVSLTGGTLALWNQLKPEAEATDLGGRWIITNTVTESNGGKFDKEVYIYSVGVTEEADGRLSGKGEQTLYNGKTAPSRFPIAITDGRNGEEGVKANFTIQGNREFTGSFRLTIDEKDPKHLTGEFEYTAGGTRGITDVLIR